MLGSVLEWKKQEKIEREKLTESLIRLKDFLPAVSSLASKETALDLMKKENNHLEKELGKTVRMTDEETKNLEKMKLEIEMVEVGLVPYDERIDQLNETIEKCKLLDEFIAIQNRIERIGKRKERQ